jgi:uncharacterized protein YqjF (DUF2071 family)
MFNYAVDPALIRPLLPYGTEIDLFEGEAFVSIVGFLFLNTRVLGIPVPFHRNFEELNLRFYVRSGLKRGVSFVQELVPKPAVAFLANALYNEHYRVARMSHSSGDGTFGMRWVFAGREHSFDLSVHGDPQPLRDGSFEQFIAEHYWGYAAQTNGDTVEYAVEHPAWRVWPATGYRLDIDFAAHYGPEFVGTLSQTPRSVFLAEGSAVTISQGRRADLPNRDRKGARTSHSRTTANPLFSSRWFGDMAQNGTRARGFETCMSCAANLSHSDRCPRSCSFADASAPGGSRNGSTGMRS